MPKFSVALSIVVLCLLLTISQNLSPSLPIVFLGTTSIALPLGVWVGLALAAGAIAAVVIGWLFQLAISSQPKVSRPSIGGSTPPPSPNRPRRTGDDGSATNSGRDRGRSPMDERIDQGYEPLVSDRVRGATAPEGEATEAWDDEEEWVEEDTDRARSDAAYAPNSPATPPSFEVKQEPIPTYQDGSVYSYSYREDKVETGRTDDIYAAADDPRTNPQANRQDRARTAPVSPETEPLEPEIVTPFPEGFPESFEDDDRPSDRDRSPQAKQSSNPSASEDDDWMGSSKPDREDW
ncbi:MAG: hypothetical protein SWY16_22375 [Cyanobacteriota bacterium]|nr:hypothetical protein [Cyanobacteriota bacterium]